MAQSLSISLSSPYPGINTACWHSLAVFLSVCVFPFPIFVQGKLLIKLWILFCTSALRLQATFLKTFVPFEVISKHVNTVQYKVLYMHRRLISQSCGKFTRSHEMSRRSSSRSNRLQCTHATRQSWWQPVGVGQWRMFSVTVLTCCQLTILRYN